MPPKCIPSAPDEGASIGHGNQSLHAIDPPTSLTTMHQPLAKNSTANGWDPACGSPANLPWNPLECPGIAFIMSPFTAIPTPAQLRRCSKTTFKSTSPLALCCVLCYLYAMSMFNLLFAFQARAVLTSVFRLLFCRTSDLRVGVGTSTWVPGLISRARWSVTRLRR